MTNNTWAANKEAPKTSLRSIHLMTMEYLLLFLQGAGQLGYKSYCFYG